MSLDLRAQHSRLADLRREIAHLAQLKRRLEEACARGDPAVAAWVAEDETLRRLISTSAESKDRVSRLFHRTCREIYRLRKSRQGGRKPDLVTFKEKMAFFTRTKSTLPLPDEGELSEDDWEELEERSTPDGRSSKTSYELRREPSSQTDNQTQVVECKNPCIEPFNLTIKENEENKESKTEDVRYDFVVDRVLGVQV